MVTNSYQVDPDIPRLKFSLGYCEDPEIYVKVL